MIRRVLDYAARHRRDPLGAGDRTYATFSADGEEVGVVLDLRCHLAGVELMLDNGLLLVEGSRSAMRRVQREIDEAIRLADEHVADKEQRERWLRLGVGT